MDNHNEKKLKKELGLRDLVLMNIATVVGLSSLTQAAQFGWSSLPLLFIAMLFFLIPLGLVVSDLNSRIKGLGGFYLWTKKAFGEWHGFLAAWTYWLSNVVWFPAVLFTIVLSSLYIFGEGYLDLKADLLYVIPISLILLWFTILLNVIGLKFGKWIQNIGAISLWLLFGLLIITAIISLINYESASEFSSSELIPDFTDWKVLPFFAAIAYSFGGLELSSVMSSEIKNSEKTISKGIIISGMIIVLLYVIGIFSLLVAIPTGELEIVDGIAQSILSLEKIIGWPYLGNIGAILVSLSTLGLLASWMNGSARLPFAIGLDHYLPKKLGSIHPKFQTPHIALIVQGIIITVLFLISVLGSDISEAYSTIYDMSVVLYFIPFLYMFAAFLYHNLKNTGGNSIIPFFRKTKIWVWICASLGFSVIFISIILAFMPSAAIENIQLFYYKIIGGTVFLCGIGLLFYHFRK